jgi:predicted XRE-type DNA-binding protein
MDMRKNDGNPTIAPSSGNAFADLGFADAEERQTKVRLAFAINQILDQRHLPQSKAARQLGINQPKISALSNYRLAGFSVERLMHFLNALGRDVEIVIRSKPRSRRLARIFVTAA